ncbi:hypothetical protein HPB47_004055 [Ixodes persulcatus]|uniref:Uncharacterized protein n=1 Tax=Ixodes persulcatus TaxID=34615 RepID=A0AC60PGZ4_IXOPE|nr:hypothetical protein HPB47_004055 [Ixodes persulcatus]
MPTNKQFQPKVIVRIKAFFNEETVLEWFRLVWCRRHPLKPRSMLVIDSFRGHITDRVKKMIANEGCHLVIILEEGGGATSILQPLDVVLNKRFKDRVGAFYEWMPQKNNPKKPTRRVKRDLLSTVAQSVNDAWYGLPGFCAVFCKCAISALLPPSGPSDPRDSDSSDCVIMTSDDK